MKITLHDPPEGFEAEARFGFPMSGDKYLDDTGLIVYCARDFRECKYIVLTPKKKTYWRLDPVGSFNESAESLFIDVHCGLGVLNERLGIWHRDTSSWGIQWLKLTEVTE